MFQLSSTKYIPGDSGSGGAGSPLSPRFATRRQPTISTQPTSPHLPEPPKEWQPNGVPVVTVVTPDVGAPVYNGAGGIVTQPATSGITTTVYDSSRAAWTRLAIVVALSAVGVAGGAVAIRRYRRR